MAQILLIQIDGKMPNLALMKISGFHKNIGDTVGFNIKNPDKVYISCIYSWNKSKALSVHRFFETTLNPKHVFVGGGGVNYDCLSHEIEHTKPDYDLYDIDYSIGFTSRGCIRNCPFCIVPQKEGNFREHSPLNEFIDDRFDKVLLMDNNFLASKQHLEKLSELKERKLKVNFNQGLDIRLLNDSNIKALSDINYYDNKFKTKSLYFAFDNPNLEPIIIKNLKRLFNARIKPKEILVYILVGFNTSFEEDMKRVKLMKNLGVKPYIMIYNKRTDIPILKHLRRWVNRNYYQFVEWKNYDYGDSQKYIKSVCK